MKMAFESDRVFYPDANFTLRVSYGKVAGYKARDAVQYDYFTTLEGIMEKDNPDIYDYRVPAKLKELYKSKDYGRYEVDGSVPVCFLLVVQSSAREMMNLPTRLPDILDDVQYIESRQIPIPLWVFHF